jgi:signal transduction histidine kinase
VSNLVGNALDHGDREKPVLVKLGSNEGAVQVEVTNNGRPIPPDLLPRIFDPFRRGSHERHGAQKGLGLGLFIARSIVETHGGNLEVGSTDQETTFRMTLPRNPDSIRASGNVG